jgi:hypothetical protein
MAEMMTCPTLLVQSRVIESLKQPTTSTLIRTKASKLLRTFGAKTLSLSQLHGIASFRFGPFL